MKADQFIKDHGLERAREVVEGAPEGASHFMYDSELMVTDYLKHRPDVSEFSFDLWCGKYWGWKPFLRSKKRLDLPDLKRLVESVDLVNTFGGLKAAKSYVPDGYKSERLKQAIQDYESIYGEGNE